MPSESAIKVSGLTKSYGELLAVDHISFEVKRGEIFGFLGPNGAGKTTTINVLTGVTKPTSGTAKISGFDVTSRPRKAKELVGVVPEIMYLYAEMTVWENINFSAKLHNMPKERRTGTARELLHLFGLYEKRDQRVDTLSRGMKQCLMIATALVHQPDILFLDEPTTGLDVQGARQIRDLIKELNRKGTTVFLTTHYIEEADQLCQRIAILNKGQIVTVGTPEELKSSAQTEQTIEVSFDHEVVTDQLERLSGVKKVISNGDKFKLYVQNPPDTLPLIFSFADENRLKVTSINTLKPTLEDAFVELTGLGPEIMTMEKQHKGASGG